MENNLIEIFIGSDIEAGFISSILTENNIDHIIKNNLNQSLSAGWVSGSQYSSSSIHINIQDTDKAKQIINEYLENNY